MYYQVDAVRKRLEWIVDDRVLAAVVVRAFVPDGADERFDFHPDRTRDLSDGVNTIESNDLGAGIFNPEELHAEKVGIRVEGCRRLRLPTQLTLTPRRPDLEAVGW
jgi:hypothetical protein